MSQQKQNRRKSCFRCKSSQITNRNHNKNEIQNNPTNNNTINVNPNINISVNVPTVNQCECSGTLNIQDPEQGISFIANICPGCGLQGSFISFVFGDTALHTIPVTPPVCTATEQGTILTAVTQENITIDSQTVPAMIRITLIELPDGDDIALLELNEFIDGSIILIFFLFMVPDEDLTVTSCSQSSQTSSIIFDEAKIRNLRNSIGRGRIVIFRDGILESREL